MLTTVAEPAEKFDTTIQVAGATVSPWKRADGTPTVEIDFGGADGITSLTPESACSLAAALQAVAVHQMEQRSEVAA